MNLPVVTDLALDHEPSFWLSTDTENGFFFITKCALLLPISGRSFSRCRLDRRSECIVEIEAEVVLVVHKLHMLFENMERSVGLPKQLFAFSHPVFVASHFFLQIRRTMRFAVEVLQTLDNISNVGIH